jgi:hypothetical protein
MCLHNTGEGQSGMVFTRGNLALKGTLKWKRVFLFESETTGFVRFKKVNWSITMLIILKLGLAVLSNRN